MITRSQSPVAKRQRSRLRWIISALLIIVVAWGMVPASVAASLARDATLRSVSLMENLTSFWSGWLIKRKPKGGTQQEIQISTGTKPQPPPSKSQREANVSSIRISPKGDITLESGKSLLIFALPLDRDGLAVQGLACEWTTSNKEVLAISQDGEAVGGKPGIATLTARAGQITQTKAITVVEATSGPFGPQKPKSTRRKTTDRDEVQDGSPANRSKRHHGLGNSPMFDIYTDPLPDDETPSLYDPVNVVGSPPGKKKPGASTPPAAITGTESGNQNFSFGLPVVGMSGRGVGVSLSLVYNSQVWNKSAGGSATAMTYDVDSGWPSPGFRLGFGQIEDQSDSFTLTDPNGTRHALILTSTNNYDTSDGTFIHYTGGSTSGTLYYGDGTVVTYGAGGGGYRLYPTKITDRNGNYITIAYAGTSGAGPQIDYVRDTLDRYLNFYYATNGDLVTITRPGLTGHDPLQVMRFYYADVTIPLQDIHTPSSNLFDSSIQQMSPATVHALKYVFLPTSSDGSSPIYTGYKFDYSSYGMIYRTTQLRGMTVSSTSTSSAGSVTNDGSTAAQTTYDYPTSASTLTDVPTYSTRSDEWAGRTSGGSAPAYTFANSVATLEKISTVTAPDGTVTETHAIDHSGFWDDGLISDTYVQYGSTPTVLSHVHLDWDHDSANNNQRVAQIRTTDVPAGLTKATVFTYTDYNNVSVVSERDFSTDGSVSNTKLRKTETTYVTSSSYINRHLLHLPATVTVVEGETTTVVSRVDYAFDNYGSSHGDMTHRDDIIRHDPAFDPFGSSYDSSTDYRGNVTSVTTYTDANTPSGSITHASTYDIAGNVMSAEVDCCHLKSFTYSGAGSGALHDYSQVIEVHSGNPSGIHFTTLAEFDQNTGLPSSATDENSTKTEYSYNLGSLRLNEIDVKNSSNALQADITYSYSDGTGPDAFVMVRTKLDSSRNVDSFRYFDGRGAVVRTFGNYTSTNGYVTQDVEYDSMGRAYRANNPYYTNNRTDSVPTTTSFWTTSSFDHLDRVTQVTMPRGDNDNSLTTSVSTSFDGVYTTVTDQASKQRRQKVDALGRVVRLDEPTISGLGSTGSSNQSTSYEYDLLDNLVHIHQDAQHRYFKYDSLSRLIREKQVEQETNSSYNLSDSWNTGGTWTRKIEYNSSGLVTDGYDARGVHTSFSYDDLNRVTQIAYSDSTPTAHYYYDSQTLPSGAPSYTHSNTQNRLLAMTYGSGTPITGNYFAYDAMGRVVTQKQLTGSTVYSLAYTYNNAGLLATETYPSTRQLTYSYDDGGRLAGVSDGTTTFANSFSYGAHGGLTSETWGNSAVHAQTYNRRLQANQIKLSKTVSGVTEVLQQYDYGYGEFNTTSGSTDTSKNNGQIGKVTGTIGTSAQWNQGFSYDELGRLSNVTEHTGSGMATQTYAQSYTLDRYGNRFQTSNSTLGLQTVSSSEIVASTNRFITTGSTPTTYDEAGNITQDTKFRGLKYSYDANGRQSEVKALDDTSLETSVYDCAGLRVQTTAGSITRTMIYDVFGQNVADYLGSSSTILERENIYRGGQLLATDDSPTVASPSALSGSLSGGNISLSWTAAAGAANYRVERKAAGGSFTLKSTTSSNSLTDSSVSSNTAYLYRVCTADSTGACLSSYSNVALGTTITFTTDPTIYTEAENPGNGTTVKHEHIVELRVAVNAVRTLAGLSTITTPSPATGDLVYASDVKTLRTKLGEAYAALGLYSPAFTDPTICGVSDGSTCTPATTIKKAHITELRSHCTGGGSCNKSISQFVTDAYQGVLHRSPTSTELSNGTSTLTQAQSLGMAQLLAAAQSLLSTLFNSPEYSGLSTSNAQFVTDLYEGYLQRAPDDSGYAYWLGQINGGRSRSTMLGDFGGSSEFQTNVTSLCIAFGGGGGLHYVLSDLQGSARVTMNNNGSSSAVVARHDYLPFGEEIGSGIGSRSLSQGYNASDGNRWKYGMTERDATSGLDHTWFRKYESLSGRWTSPDPYGGSMTIANAQSFNRYAHVRNDPVNFIDPSGLDGEEFPIRCDANGVCWAADGSLIVNVNAGQSGSVTGLNGTGGTGIMTQLGPGFGGDAGGGGPQKTDQSNETGECAGIRGQLVGNPFNAAALDAVWRRSQQDVKHEEGGLLGYTYGGGPVDSIFTIKGVGATTSLEGFTTWAQKKISAGRGFVTYMFWYHAHPHDKGEVLPNGDKVGDPDFPSHDDQLVSGHVGLLGILVSKQRIVVFDKQGFIKCYFDR